MKKFKSGGKVTITHLKLKKDSNGKKMPAVMHTKRGKHSKAMTAKMKGTHVTGGEGSCCVA
jgi:hypothetical protein